MKTGFFKLYIFAKTLVNVGYKMEAKLVNLWFLALKFTLILYVFNWEILSKYFQRKKFKSFAFLYLEISKSSRISIVLRLFLLQLYVPMSPLVFSENKGLVDTIAFCTARTAKWLLYSDATKGLLTLMSVRFTTFSCHFSAIFGR